MQYGFIPVPLKSAEDAPFVFGQPVTGFQYGERGVRVAGKDNVIIFDDLAIYRVNLHSGMGVWSEAVRFDGSHGCRQVQAVSRKSGEDLVHVYATVT